MFDYLITLFTNSYIKSLNFVCANFVNKQNCYIIVLSTH